MTKYMPFVYDEANFLTNQKCFIVTGQCMAFLTAFFNSSLFKFCFRDSFPELQGGTRELSKIFFDKIPVLQVSDSINETFRHIVNKIQASYTKEQARNIDNMLFDLYNLTADERKVIGYVEITSVRDKPFVKCKFHRPCIVTQESARSYDMGGCMMKAFPC